MEEMAESSGAKPRDEIWAKLVSSDSRYSDVEIRSDEIVICSEISSTSTDKHNWCKIVRNSDLCSATIENKRSNTILVDGAKLCNEDTIVIKDGSEIVPGPDGEGFVNYRFNIMSSPETCQRQLKICIDVEHAKCSICLNLWHDVVTVAPCLHNFCNGCLSEWLRRSEQRRSAVLCPQCRAVVQFVGKNHFLRAIADDMVKADSSLRRADEDIALLDSYSSIRSNLVLRSGNNRRKRALTSTPPNDQSDDGSDLRCPQCVTEVAGFRCNHSTDHLQCQACGGMMPSRTDLGIPQHCSGCDRPFCGAYWHTLGVARSGSYPICSQDTLKPISEHTISRIPLIAHEKNLHEHIITENCIRQMGRTLQDVISEWIVNLDNRLIDRTRLMLNNAEMITARTIICRDCYEKLVSFLLYWFRISCPRNYYSEAAIARQDCWYGYACRTQHHSEDHARKRNHVCRPTRGNAS
ncbi:hypothetical protein HN51_012762 [Arachis hypogaea]|uniref:Uncharacterized protein LOC107480145 isoform X1 n=1 Tax=Arachis duranensis TaxID=130453 RepID=A0A6P4CR86_ARADU|nr:uncharacterized protein LOC107480145 isoform X1 [Arachis duranensis]XP_025689499.1 E3 ubiquitin-protein ligase CHFR isoform X1 [Arachis hypogaea]QHO58325.1 E3 ubiquitin-protein ligase CHFR [Arachis hypogaea]